MDAASAAPKRKGRDSPAAVEIAAEKRRRRDSPAGVEIDAATAGVEIDAATAGVEIDAATAGVEIVATTSAVEINAATAAVGIDASTVVVEIDAVIAGAKDQAATARLLAVAKEQAVRIAKLYSGFAHPVVETAATNDARLVVPESVKLMADYIEHMVEMEVVSDRALETVQRSFDYAIDEMIAKRPTLAALADELSDLRLRQASKAETRRASTRVTGFVRSLYAVVSNINFGALTWKTDDTFVIASESSLKKFISNGHFGDLSYFDFDRELEQHGFLKSEGAEYRHKLGHFRRDCPDLLANIVREPKIEALSG